MQTWLRRILAIVSMVGSVYGLSAVYTNFGNLNAGGGSYFELFLTLLGGLFFLYGIMCSFWLLERRTGSTTANVIFWLAQIPVLITGFLSYHIYALGNLAMTTNLDFATFGVTMNIPDSNFLLMMGDSGKDGLIGFNMFALLMIVLLISVGISTRREKGLISNLKSAATIAGGAAALTGAAVVAGAKGAASVANKAGDVAGGAMDAAKATASVAGDMAGKAVDVAGGAASSAADTAVDAAGGAMDAAKATASAAGDMAGKAVDVAGSAASSAADTAVDAAGGAKDAAKATASVAGDMAGGATNMAGAAAAAVAGTAGVVASGAMDAAGGAITGVAETTGNLTQSTMDAAKEAAALIGGATIDGVDNGDDKQEG